MLYGTLCARIPILSDILAYAEGRRRVRTVHGITPTVGLPTDSKQTERGLQGDFHVDPKWNKTLEPRA